MKTEDHGEGKIEEHGCMEVVNAQLEKLYNDSETLDSGFISPTEDEIENGKKCGKEENGAKYGKEEIENEKEYGKEEIENEKEYGKEEIENEKKYGKEEIKNGKEEKENFEKTSEKRYKLQVEAKDKTPPSHSFTSSQVNFESNEKELKKEHSKELKKENGKEREDNENEIPKKNDGKKQNEYNNDDKNDPGQKQGHKITSDPSKVNLTIDNIKQNIKKNKSKECQVNNEQNKLLHQNEEEKVTPGHNEGDGNGNGSNEIDLGYNVTQEDCNKATKQLKTVILKLISKNRSDEVLRVFAHSASCPLNSCIPMCLMFRRIRRHLVGRKHPCGVLEIYGEILRKHVDGCTNENCGLPSCPVLQARKLQKRTRDELERTELNKKIKYISPSLHLPLIRRKDSLCISQLNRFKANQVYIIQTDGNQQKSPQTEKAQQGNIDQISKAPHMPPLEHKQPLLKLNVSESEMAQPGNTETPQMPPLECKDSSFKPNESEMANQSETCPISTAERQDPPSIQEANMEVAEDNLDGQVAPIQPQNPPLVQEGGMPALDPSNQNETNLQNEGGMQQVVNGEPQYIIMPVRLDVLHPGGA